MVINDVDNNKVNKKVNIIHELNILDKMISADCNKLLNEFYANEMKNNSEMEPTPVTIATIKGGKKKKEMKHENLRVLLDTASSHCLMNEKYSSKNKRTKSNKKYSTRSGVLKTKYE